MKIVIHSKEEAEASAEQIFKRARPDKDCNAAGKQYCDNRDPGVYGMANSGVQLETSLQEFSRDQRSPALGMGGFKLEVGNIGMAGYHPKNSPSGYPIVKRIQ